MKKKIILSLLIPCLAISIAGCAKKEDPKEEKQPVAVTAQTAEDRRQIEEKVKYAALVYPEEEALIIAKTNGTAREVKFKLGDKVKAGDVLIKIDDASGKNPAGNYSFNASQVKQAQLAVQQAYTALTMAQTDYQNSNSVASENYRAAKIAYESAKLATEQAKTNLENQKKQTDQSGNDTITNSILAANTAANTCDSIISGLNDNLGLGHDHQDIPYLKDLSAMDTSLINQAKNEYSSAEKANQVYKLGVFADTASQIKAAIDLALKTKKVSDTAKKMMDKTPSAGELVLSALVGTIGAYQAQANGALAQANGAKQSLENTGLGIDSNLSMVQKAYELAQKQEAAALQNLNTLKTSQNSQFDLARIQYQNAVAVLQGLYDTHLAVAPINGIITRKEIDNGTTISMGQILASVSQTDKTKIQFFVDEDSLKYLKPEQAVEIADNDGKIITGKISNLSSRADDTSKKFLVEVKPDNNTLKLTAGTVVNVDVVLKKKSSADNAIILPLSAVEVTQNNSYIFTVENNLAKKITVKILKVDGENAQVEFTGDAKTLIIIDGNKLVREGDPVKTQ